MSSTAKQDWFIYALGGGWGHLTRSFALARAAAKQGIASTVFTNSEYASIVQRSALFEATSDFCRFEILPADVVKETLPEVVAQLLGEGNYSRLVVDTFPRGLAGDLVDLIEKDSLKSGGKPVLISRDINPSYVEKFRVCQFTARNFGVLINPGEEHHVFFNEGSDSNFSSSVRITAPWTVLDASELPSRDESRSRLGIFDCEVPLVLVIACGTLAEGDFYWQVARRLGRTRQDLFIRFLAAQAPKDFEAASNSKEKTVGGSSIEWLSHYPGIECIRAADVVIGGAGYNTISECQAAGVPLIAFPQNRLYDRQDLRAKSRAESSAPIFSVSSAAEAEAILLRILNGLEVNPCVPTITSGARCDGEGRRPADVPGGGNRVNGVHEAVEIICSCD